MITVLAEQPENKGLMHFLSILVVLCDKKGDECPLIRPIICCQSQRAKGLHALTGSSDFAAEYLEPSRKEVLKAEQGIQLAELFFCCEALLSLTPQQCVYVFRVKYLRSSGLSLYTSFQLHCSDG